MSKVDSGEDPKTVDQQEYISQASLVDDHTSNHQNVTGDYNFIVVLL